MSISSRTIELRTSPHIHQGVTTDVIMLNVVYALLPVVGFAVFAFGLSALLLVMVATATCVLTEHVVCRISGKPTTILDYSSWITGILLALTLPPGFPLWMTVVGGVISIALGKALFGGLGFNPFNPALVGRAFLQAAFPVAITTWSPAFAPERLTRVLPSTLTPPFMKALEAVFSVDGFSGATPLSAWKFEHKLADTSSLFLGTTAGSAGETSALLILICGAYLIARGMMNWRIPTGVLLAVFAVSELFYLSDPESYPPPLFMLFSGGLMLGALFMASDLVASPTTTPGVWIYGVLIGLLTVIIRLKGGLPEGVMYAILIGNGVSPLIESLTQPRVYGAKRGARNP
jgi:electron transport complex protein RnfD